MIDDLSVYTETNWTYVTVVFTKSGSYASQIVMWNQSDFEQYLSYRMRSEFDNMIISSISLSNTMVRLVENMTWEIWILAHDKNTN